MALTTEKIDSGSNYCYNPILKINQSNDRYSIACYDPSLKKIKYGTLDVNGQLYFETIDPEASYDAYNAFHVHSLDLDSNGYPHISYVDTTSYYLHYSYQDISGWHSEIVDLNTSARDNSIAIDSNGYPHIAYAKYISSNKNDLMHAYKDNDGWHIYTLDNTVYVRYPSIALDNLNYAHISYAEYTNYDLEYAYQDVNGWHLETVDSVGNPGYYNSIAIDSLNRPHISYYDFKLKYALKDSGAWAIETVDSSSAAIGILTSIVTDSANRPHISYIDSTNSDLKYTYKDSGAWNSTIVNINCSSNMTSIDLTSTDLPQIGYQYGSNSYRAYYNGTWNSEKLLYFGNYNKVIIDNDNEVRISSYGSNFFGYGYMDDDRWKTTLLDSNANLGIDIAIDQNNYAHISYHYPSSADLKHAYQDASGWHLEAVDSQGQAGFNSSIAIDQSNYPHISYYYHTAGQVKHAYKDGAGWHTEVINNIGNSTSDIHTSIKINSANYPYVSYYDSANTNLMYAYKDGTGWHSETVDSDGLVGTYASLDLDSFDYPHIAYYDATNLKVKYAYQDISGWHTEFVDTDASYGTYITLKLNSSNIPYISYYNSATQFLNFAYKDNSWVVQTVNGIYAFGQYPSLALDNDDNVHMVGYSNASIPPFYSGVVYHIFGSAPTSTSIAINSGASYTNTTAVTLNLSASSDAYQMMVSEDPAFTGASWETYATSKNFTLSSGDGTKTVYVKYRDKLLSESAGISSTIILDETAPTVTSAIADPDPAKPGNVTVSLQFSEDMDTTVSPTVNITGLVSSPYVVTQSSFIGNTWTGTFALLDDDEITTAVISVTGAKDLAGNTMLADSSAGTFEVNTIAPYLTSIIVNPNPAIPGTVGVILYFSQAMDTTVTPTVTINGLTNSYTVSQNIYGSTIWYGTFTLNPDNEDATATISVTGAKDIAGNTMLPDLSASTFQVESILPTISSISYTPNPAQAGLVTVTIVFSENMLTTALPVVEITGLRDENYTLTQASYSGKTWTGNIVLDNTYTNTSGYISVRNAKDLAGNTMISQSQAMTFTALDSMATDFDQTLNLEQTNLLRTYQDQAQDIKVYFYEKPSNSKGLYLTLIRKNKKYSSKYFNKKKLYPSYLILKSNIKNIRKTTFKITFHYKTKKLKKNKLKEKNLRLFIKDRNNKWRGPFSVYQNKEKNIIKFKIRNYYLKPGLAFVARKSKGNRNYAPYFKFFNISKIKFVIADKDAFSL